MPNLGHKCVEDPFMFLRACLSVEWPWEAAFTVILIRLCKDTHEREIPELLQEVARKMRQVYLKMGNILSGINGNTSFLVIFSNYTFAIYFDHTPVFQDLF